MLQVFIALLLIQTPSPGGPGEPRLEIRDRTGGPTPVTDKDLRPYKAPDCQSEPEMQRAVAQVRNGEPGDCFVRDLSAFDRYKG